MDNTIMVINYLRYSGTKIRNEKRLNRFIKELAPLVNLGWNVYLLIEEMTTESTWMSMLHEAGIKVLFAGRPAGNFNYRCIKNAYELCNELNIHIIHCDNIHTSPLIGAYLARVPVRVWSKRAMNPSYEMCRELTIKERISISLRITCQLSTAIHAVSNKVKEEVLNYGANPRKICVINNVYEEPLPFAPSKKYKSLYNISDNEIILATIGHAVPVKGWDVLLRALGLVIKEYKEVKLLLVGSYLDEHEIEFAQGLVEMIGRYGLRKNVIMTGHIDNVNEMLAITDIYIQPSLSEGCCNALIEALCHKLPTISTKEGNAPELISDGVDGYLIERSNAEELADRILLLANSQKKRIAIRNNIDISNKIPTWDVYVNKMIALYKSGLDSTKWAHFTNI